MHGCMTDIIPEKTGYLRREGTELLMRCLLPNEDDEHTFFFKLPNGIEPTKPGVMVRLLCLPVTFNEAGRISIKFEEQKTGIEEVYLNKRNCPPVVPGSTYLCVLFPYKREVNELRLCTSNSRFKLLICIHTIKRPLGTEYS